MGALGAGAPYMFSDSYIARPNLYIHTDHTALYMPLIIRVESGEEA